MKRLLLLTVLIMIIVLVQSDTDILQRLMKRGFVKVLPPQISKKVPFLLPSSSASSSYLDRDPLYLRLLSKNSWRYHL
ncbi:unnamed protein product, partial [Mesorhabditis belari]|uniref:Uncharacterized protein n=1 Tax=Mesorhabditis belari TaxID=2138241 RepID=A0AAF3FPP7_9BILA